MRSTTLVYLLCASICMASLGCDNSGSSTAEGSGAAVINVRTATLTASDIARMVVIVSGDGIAPDIVVELHENPEDAWSGIVDNIPVGLNRQFTAEAYDAAGTLIYTGAAMGVTIESGVTISVTIYAQQVDPPEPFLNAVPIINSLVVSPMTVEVGGDVELIVEASDANSEDALSYDWTATAGSFSDEESPSTVWTAPMTAGIHTVAIAVSDPHDAVTELSVDIAVDVPGGAAVVGIVVNSSPEVNALVPTPTRIDVGESTQLDLIATDPDGDDMTYVWSADCDGVFDDETGEDPSFVLNTLTGVTCTLTVQIRDNNGGSNYAAIAIQTGPAVEPENIPVGCEGPLVFPDEHLDTAIRTAIGKPTGDIYFADVVGLHSLHTAPQDLTGIECMKHLAELDLTSSFIADFSPLAELPDLTKLILYDAVDNTSISTLPDLTGLTYLDLEFNLISNISTLTNLTSLTFLDLSYNAISNISALADLTNLTYLDLRANAPEDLSPLSNLTQLSYLDLTFFNEFGAPVNDISPLSNLTNLTSLFLSQNAVTDITPLTNLVNLKTLDLSDNQFGDIYPLVANSGIDDEDIVSIWGNPIDLEDPMTLGYIAELEGRGVDLRGP